MNVLKPIETRYAGCRFRSRLEARWACYFDAIGLRWEHEREGYDLGDGIYYLPDFWLNDVQMWAEVKPEELNAAEMEKVRRLTKQGGRPCLLLVGAPACRTYHVFQWFPDIEAGNFWGCVISNYRKYPRTERRFFCDSGGEVVEDDFMGEFCRFADVKPAVARALSARFERVEGWM